MPAPIKPHLLTNYRPVSNPSYYVDRSSVRAVQSKKSSKISTERNKYCNIKGRIAETLIKELFIDSGYKVFHYGMEYAMPQIMEDLDYSQVAEQIRKMPDFVVKNNTTNKVHFVEVKYRTNGEFCIADLKQNYPYDDAIIIVVSTKHIKCLSVAELRDGKKITAGCKNYLGNRSEFKLKKTVIVEFCNLANRLFDAV